MNFVSTRPIPSARRKRRVTMFEVTEKAAEMLLSALKDRTPVPPIRIALFEGG